MTSVLDDEAYVLLSGEVYAGFHILRAADSYSIRGRVSKRALARAGAVLSERRARVIQIVRRHDSERVLEAA